ncbi:MAG: hypothetical protein IPO88_30960 [Nannocystis sp.]|uniref:MYXO-CTERM sorting domain-containing protein n=1 Tax=Nannocystis sp. TaxID=1962667 RepID=UPI002421ABF1|nr:MYXO-CTERM sorting domain-containing protein [Nannocystis sp.]MBK9757854.1 hypothetical protein [Nannocystis sp.]
MTPRICLAPALLVASALILRPAEAAACDPDPCYQADLWQTLAPVNASLIPGDGVLVLQGANPGDPAAWLDKVALTVTLDATPVAGALEAPGINGVLVWRPDAPLVAGMYKVMGTLDNPDDLDYCGEDLLLDFEFMSDGGAAVPLTPPSLTPMEVVSTTQIVDLETLVCCEGVVPGTSFNDCGGDSVDYPEGQCAPTQGTGWLDVQLPIAPMLPIGTAAMLAYSLKVDGAVVARTLSPQLGWQASAPFCTEVVVTNLGTGETLTTDKQCHGDAVASQLGPQDLDPALAITCSEPLQTCAVNAMGDAWDPNMCTPWPPEGETGTPTEGGSDSAGSDGSGGSGGSAGEAEPGEKGCGCVGGGAPGPWALPGVLVLAGLRRRRRA